MQKYIGFAILILFIIAGSAYSLMPAEKTGKLYIYSEIENVKIYVDNVYKADDFVEIESIQTGTHYVKVIEDNEVIHSSIAAVKGGEVTTVIIRENEGKRKEKFSFRGGVSLVHTNFTYTQSLGDLSASENLKPNFGFDFNVYKPLNETWGIEAGYLMTVSGSYTSVSGPISINANPFYFNGIVRHEIFYGGGGINYSFWGIGASGASLSGGLGYQIFAGLEGFNICGELGYTVMNGTISGDGVSMNHSMTGSYIKLGYKS